jgi:acetylornithine deacetylase/succinyl-diaminopimelate desuccinylase-like protein
MLTELTNLVDDSHVRFEVLSSMEAAVSPWEDPLYEALVRAATAAGGVAGPVISVGFTDSIYLRVLGVRAYGFVPFVLSEEEVATMHGNDERVSTENLERGLRVLATAVAQFATSANGDGLNE